MSTLPRYKFDPVTQKYTLLNPQEMAQRNVQEQGGLNAIASPMDGGGDPSAPSGPSASMMSPGMAEFGVGAQNLGLALSGIPSMTTALAGMAATGIGNAMMGSQVSPVANPAATSTTSISPNQDPVAALAAMVAQSQQEQDDNDAQAAQEAAVAAVADAAAAATTAAPGVADAPAADTATATAATDSGGGYGGDNASPGDSPSDGGPSGGDSDPGAGPGVGTGEKEGGLISMKRYADGGMTMSPQNYGRMGDSMLVHMNPREVAGLQSLARSQGTSLTVNPQTGYPEAFNLQALLPIIAGLALGPAGYGLTAVNAGLATAALGTVATGSLKKGLMAGLGAYGGAGLGEGLVGATGAEATMTPTSPALNPTPPVPGVTSTYPGAASPGIVSPNVQLGTQGFSGSSIDPSNFANPATVATPSTAAAGTAPGFGSYSNISPSSVASPQISPSSFTPDTALSGVSPTPDKFIGNLSGKDAFKYGTAAVASIPPPEYEPPESTAMLRPYDYSFNPITGAYDPRPGDSSEVLYGTPTFTAREVVPARAGGMMSSYAAGGLAAFKEGGRPKSRRLMDEKGLGGIPYYDFMSDRNRETNLESVEKNFAQGGTPRFLSGGGDGMSDDIPAMIGDKQPARLADGEFVIPADVVSHIGNGSSKAGAKRLYKMMADIREERTGKTKQAPAIKPDRYMPA